MSHRYVHVQEFMKMRMEYVLRRNYIKIYARKYIYPHMNRNVNRYTCANTYYTYNIYVWLYICTYACVGNACVCTICAHSFYLSLCTGMDTSHICIHTRPSARRNYIVTVARCDPLCTCDIRICLDMFGRIPLVTSVVPSPDNEISEYAVKY